MALILRKRFFETVPSVLQFKRFKGKINVKRPKPAHFERALFLEFTKPWYVNPDKGKTPQELCKGFKEEFDWKKDEMDNPLQKIVAREVYEKFLNSKLVMFFHLNPVKEDVRHNVVMQFQKKNMIFKQYGKKTMQMAVENTPFEPVLNLYVSQNMILFSPEPDIKSVLKIIKRHPQFVLLAGIFCGRMVSKDDLVKYSAIPDIKTAQMALVQTLNALGCNLVSNLNAHQTQLSLNLEERIKQLKEES